MGMDIIWKGHEFVSKKYFSHLEMRVKVIRLFDTQPFNKGSSPKFASNIK